MDANIILPAKKNLYHFFVIFHVEIICFLIATWNSPIIICVYGKYFLRARFMCRSFVLATWNSPARGNRDSDASRIPGVARLMWKKKVIF